jgi:hypothetical protein
MFELVSWIVFGLIVGGLGTYRKRPDGLVRNSAAWSRGLDSRGLY